MKIICGIYGYQITQAIVLPGLIIEPRTADHKKSKEWARDLDCYHLTAVLKCEEISNDLLFNLEAILSFIEHLDVLISLPKKDVNSDMFSNFTKIITTHKRINGGGAVIGEDAFFPNSRSQFIAKALEKLQDKEFCETSQFNILFFKCVETFRQSKSFVEVTYFLLYSGLESYSRSVMNDVASRNSSEPICQLLNNYNFDVRIENPNNLKKAVSTYTHLRNALFHNSQFTTTINVNGTDTELKLFDYLFNISQLVVLVIMKAVEFDDGHINWNSWIDRQAFK